MWPDFLVKFLDSKDEEIWVFALVISWETGYNVIPNEVLIMWNLRFPIKTFFVSLSVCYLYQNVAMQWHSRERRQLKGVLKREQRGRRGENWRREEIS